MKAQIQKWGNSLAIRIPKTFANETNLRQGSNVEIGIKESCIILKPVIVKKYSLKSLLSGVNKANIHEEANFGKAQGLEIW